MKWKKLLTIASVILFLFLLAGVGKAYMDGRFESAETFQEYIKGFGLFAPIVLIVLQALQVIFPILPGFLGCAVGAVLFGSLGGFWCNYIGISLGSVIAYFLARKYGMNIVLAMFPEKQYEKWSRRVEKSRSYERFLFIATLLPLFPDDFLCYFSGLIKMNSKKFIWIIILGKPWCILAYSVAFGLI